MSTMHKVVLVLGFAIVLTAGISGCAPAVVPATPASASASASASAIITPAPTSTRVASSTPAAIYPNPPETWIVSAAGIGPLELGMTASELSATGIAGLTVSTSDNCLVGYAQQGDATILAGGTAKKPMTVDMVSISELDGPRSELGIGVGSTLQDALTAYPGSVYTPATQDNPGGVRWATGGTYVVFETDAWPSSASDVIAGFTVGLKDGHAMSACP